MKAKQLLGVVTSGILIIPSVVVAFVQQAATTSYRRAHSSIQIASSNNDLTSLLETTKYGVETGKQFVKTTGSKVTDAAITTSIPPPEDDKALPLGNFIRETLIGHKTGSVSPDSSSWDTAAANVSLLRDNLFSTAHYFKDLPDDAKPWLAGATVATLVIIGSSKNTKKPSKKVPVDIQATSNAIGSLTYELGSLQSRMKSLEANGLKLDSKLKDATSKLTLKELDISKARLKAADISLNLGREIELLKQKLDANDAKVVTLDTELIKARAECELLIKELDKAKNKKNKKVSSEVSKEEKKINSATVSKKKNVRSKKTALKKSKPKNEEKLQLAYTDEAEPSTEEKVKEKDPVKSAAKKKTPSPNKESSEVIKEETKINDATVPKKKNVRSEKTAPKKLKPKNKEKLQLASTDTAEPSTEKKVKEKDPVKSVPKQKTPSANKEVTKVQTVELPTAEAPLKKKTSVEKKVVTEVKKTSEDLQKASTTKDTTLEIKMESNSSKVSPEKIDFTTLSKSALSRKTVKELKEFLESKGLSITEDDGKPLKKNGLLEAVRSL